MVKRGWLGDKAGQGFYKKMRGADGKEERLVLDLATLEYRPTTSRLCRRWRWRRTRQQLRERLKMLLAAIR